jgi:hypothetical protein
MPLNIRPKRSKWRRLYVGTVNDRELLVNCSKTEPERFESSVREMSCDVSAFRK